MNKKLLPIRQGDVVMIPIKRIPENAKKLKDKIMAYGEVTGHTHRFIEPKNIDRYELDGKLYLQVRVSSTIIHEEHNPLIIPVGDYQQIQEREYSYEDEEMKKVID